MAELSVNIPVIETERLTLREPREADFEAFAAFSATDRTKFIGGKLERFDAWRAFTSGLGSWLLRAYGYWMIEDKATAAPAGRVGFGYGDGWAEPELGWHVFGGYEGKGVAYEAALAAREAGARHFRLNGVISYVDPDNQRSRRLADRLGATVESEGMLLGHPVLIYRHPKVLA